MVSTIATGLTKALGARFIEADDFRFLQRKSVARRIPLTCDRRWTWLHAIAAEARIHEVFGVLAWSASRRACLDRLRQTFRQFSFKHLAADGGLLDDRVAARQDYYTEPLLVQSQPDTIAPPDNGKTTRILSAFDPPDVVIGCAAAFAAKQFDSGLLTPADNISTRRH